METFPGHVEQDPPSPVVSFGEIHERRKLVTPHQTFSDGQMRVGRLQNGNHHQQSEVKKFCQASLVPGGGCTKKQTPAPWQRSQFLVHTFPSRF